MPTTIDEAIRDGYNVEKLQQAFEEGAVVDNNSEKTTFYCAVNEVKTMKKSGIVDVEAKEFKENLKKFFKVLFDNGMTAPADARKMAESRSVPNDVVSYIEERSDLTPEDIQIEVDEEKKSRPGPSTKTRNGHVSRFTSSNVVKIPEDMISMYSIHVMQFTGSDQKAVKAVIEEEYKEDPIAAWKMLKDAFMQVRMGGNRTGYGPAFSFNTANSDFMAELTKDRGADTITKRQAEALNKAIEERSKEHVR